LSGIYEQYRGIKKNPEKKGKNKVVIFVYYSGHGTVTLDDR